MRNCFKNIWKLIIVQQYSCMCEQSICDMNEKRCSFRALVTQYNIKTKDIDILSLEVYL